MAFSEQSSNTRRGLSDSDAQALCDRILGSARADHTRVHVRSGVRGFTRTAMNRVTTAGTTDDIAIRVTSTFGRRTASVNTNRTDTNSLERVVREAETLARLSPEDPEFVPPPGPQTYADVNGYYPSTGDLTTEDRARSAAIVLARAEAASTVAAGFIDVFAGSEALANSNELFAYHASTGVASTLTIRTNDGLSSGWAGGEGADWNTIESERIAEVALRKCETWRGKTALSPGKYEVVLEPTAAGMLLMRMMGSFDARSAEEGRSYLSRRGGGTLLGEKIFDERVTIVSDPVFVNGEVAPFTGEGEPVRKEVWVERGVVKNLSYSRFWAERKNVPAKAPMSNFFMSGGDASLDDLIRSVTYGVLITRFWYIRPLNPRTLTETGLTRDGTFLIENGQISRPVTNFRFNQSIVELLRNVEMLSRPVRVCAGENSSVGTPVIVPALKVRDFNLASVSDAV